MKAALGLTGLVAVALAVGLPACNDGPLVLVSVSRKEGTTDGALKVKINTKEVDSFTSVPLSGQPLHRGYRISSDNPKLCVRLEFTPSSGSMVAPEVAWKGDPITWTVGGPDPMGAPCTAGVGGMGGAAGGRSGSGGAAGGRSGEGAAGQGGTGATGTGGAAGGPASSGGTTGQGGGPSGSGGAPVASGGAGGRGGASGSSGGRGGQPASSGGMMMVGSGGATGGRGIGSGGAM